MLYCVGDGTEQVRVGGDCWNDPEKGKAKYVEQNAPECRFVRHKSHMNSCGIEPGPLFWETGDEWMCSVSSVVQFSWYRRQPVFFFPKISDHVV